MKQTFFERKIDRELADWRSNPNRKSLTITGPRGVGKTTAVRRFGAGYRHYVEIDLEMRPKFRRIFSEDLYPDTLVRKMRNVFGKDALVPGETLIVLDEVQFCPGARTCLKPFTEDPDWDVIALTSFPYVRGVDQPHYPVGYENRMSMHPMGFEEFLRAKGIGDGMISLVKDSIRSKEPLERFELDFMDRMLREYLVAGGMPEAVRSLITTGDEDDVAEAQRMLAHKFLSDAEMYSDVRNRGRMPGCLESVATQADGIRFRYSAVGSAGKVGHREYDGCMGWLMDAGICFPCYRAEDLAVPFSVRWNLFRMHMCDIGLLASMIPGAAKNVSDPQVRLSDGPLGRGFVAAMLHSQGVEAFSYVKKTTQMDFVTGFDGIPTAIQVRGSTNPHSRSMDSVMRDGRIERGIKLGTENICVDGKGVECYPLFAAGFPDCLFIPRPLPEFRMGEPGRFGITP